MKHQPGPDTEKSLTDRIAFYETGAEWYQGHCEHKMAEWSRAMAKQAAEQLAVLKRVKVLAGVGLTLFD